LRFTKAKPSDSLANPVQVNHFGRTILRIYEPTAGRVVFLGVDITKLGRGQLLPYRKKMQYIFQDPYASLDPRMTVSDIVGEALDIHRLVSSKKRGRKKSESC